jgi:hypothetical protein
MMAIIKPQTVARWLFALIPLAGLISVMSLLTDQWLRTIWQFTLFITLLFYVACAIIPTTIRKLQSMPYTFNLNNNWGPDGRETQILTYACYHTHWYNHITHTAFPIEAFLWQLVLYSHLALAYNQTLAFIALTAFSLVWLFQAVSVKERFFTQVMASWWLAVGIVVVLATYLLSAEFCYHWSILLLLSLGFWRFSGHWVEPIPPGLINNVSFVSLKQAGFHIRLLNATLLGIFSEFAAGLPFRLVNTWIYVGLQQRLENAHMNYSWQQAKRIRDDIHRQGWEAHPRTKKLIENEVGVSHHGGA